MGFKVIVNSSLPHACKLIGKYIPNLYLTSLPSLIQSKDISITAAWLSTSDLVERQLSHSAGASMDSTLAIHSDNGTFGSPELTIYLCFALS